SLTVAVKATFTLSAGECALASEALPCMGDVFLDDDPDRCLRTTTDLAPLKPRGECYLVGTCHPPGGRATVSRVGFRVGKISRSLAVLGDRFWPASGIAAEPSAPLPFTSMPLSYEKSFGGPGFAANPAGKGIAPVVEDGVSRVPLPNLEDPRALVRARGDRP